jgi:hypothetical protein
MLHLSINHVIKNYALNTPVLCKETCVVISPLESFTTFSNGYLFLVVAILFLMVLSFFKYKTYIFLGKRMFFFIEKTGMILTIDTFSNIILSFFTKTSNLLYNFIVKKLSQGRFNVILPGVGLAVDPDEPINPAQAADPAAVINPVEIPAVVPQDFPGAVNLQEAVNPAEIPGQLPSPANSDHDSEWSDASSNAGDGLNLQEFGHGVIDDEYFEDGFNQQNFEIAGALHGEALPLIPGAIANILPVNNLVQALPAVPLPVVEALPLIPGAIADILPVNNLVQALAAVPLPVAEVPAVSSLVEQMVPAVVNVLSDEQLRMAMAHRASVRNSFREAFHIYQDNRVPANLDGVGTSNLQAKLDLISKTVYNIKNQPEMAAHNMEVVTSAINFVFADPTVPMVVKTVEQLASITL